MIRTTGVGAGVGAGVRIWVATAPVDMRRSFDRLGDGWRGTRAGALPFGTPLRAGERGVSVRWAEGWGSGGGCGGVWGGALPRASTGLTFAVPGGGAGWAWDGFWLGRLCLGAGASEVFDVWLLGCSKYPTGIRAGARRWKSGCSGPRRLEAVANHARLFSRRSLFLRGFWGCTCRCGTGGFWIVWLRRSGGGRRVGGRG